jgi:phage shock protein E
MQKKILSIIALTMIFSISFLVIQEMVKNDGSGRVAGEVDQKTGFKKINNVSFKEYINNPEVVLIDIRTPEEFAENGLEGAINIDYYSQDFIQKLAELDKDADYAIYCRSGNRSADAFKIMRDIGFKNVKELLGGIITL